jgi:hypothetical protein
MVHLPGAQQRRLLAASGHLDGGRRGGKVIGEGMLANARPPESASRWCVHSDSRAASSLPRTDHWSLAHVQTDLHFPSVFCLGFVWLNLGGGIRGLAESFAFEPPSTCVSTSGSYKRLDKPQPRIWSIITSRNCKTHLRYDEVSRTTRRLSRKRSRESMPNPDPLSSTMHLYLRTMHFFLKPFWKSCTCWKSENTFVKSD